MRLWSIRLISLMKIHGLVLPRLSNIDCSVIFDEI
jgi:hypothetical protein